MEVLFLKIGYSKGQKLTFLNKRLCGLWLIWIGFIIIFGTIIGGKYVLNPFIFGIGYVLGMSIMFHSTLLKKKFSYGQNTKFQTNMGNISIISMFVLMSLFSGRYFATNNYRLIWLGALLATGIHFIPFSFVHGKLSLFLSIPLIINALIGMIDLNISFYYLGIIDGLIKVLFGVIFFMSIRPKEIIE
ncbi:DUF6609 family protein [Clostridium estertheticum]|uniref:DUF6609 family protein n=1 Tax=Clostridium estertheticum TaxID=238834 RepID=UPI001CF45725|nr:DUF6609 family protein [Clostridium estertheticum]MCB2356095.1 hypothetical protein [Clostridium estertheticum]WAG43754.1 hypothetical protein LL065_24035 [Clostridium estertheticum]